MDISSVIQGGYHHPLVRSWQTRQVSKSNLVYPIFISGDPDASEPIPSFPNQRIWGVNRLQEFLTPLVQKGLKSVLLFGHPADHETLDDHGSLADDPKGPAIQAIHKLKLLFPELYIICDVCLCPYTSHGHCGILNPDGTVDTVPSIRRFAEIALSYAKAGAHCVAPSDMADGRIKAVKVALVENGLGNRCTLMSYSAKFASCLYGPFRDALDCAPAFGDRKCYQLPPGGRGLARRALLRDAAEGADILMIKPGSPYLDLVAEAAQFADRPIAVYQVSGEFAMIHAAAAAGVFNLKAMAFEAMDGFLRAGATIILTYFTPEFLDWLSE